MPVPSRNRQDEGVGLSHPVGPFEQTVRESVPVLGPQDPRREADPADGWHAPAGARPLRCVSPALFTPPLRICADILPGKGRAAVAA